MRMLVTLAAAVLATSVVAQSPLTTSFAGGNSGNVGGGIYFNLTVSNAGSLTITQIDFNTTTAVGTPGTLAVFMGPQSWVGNNTQPALWTSVASGPVVTAATGTPTTCLLGGGGFTLGPGQYGIALVSQGFNWAYTNGGGAVPSTISTANGRLTFNGGGAQNIALDPLAPTFSPRLFNGSIHYTDPGVGTPIAVASQEKYGAGCVGRWTSFYEVWGNPASNDLSNQTIRLQFAGDRYNVSMGGNPYTAPSGGAVTVALASGDTTFLASAAGLAPSAILWPDGGGAGTQVATDLEISTEGYISPAPETNPNDVTPTFGELLGGQARWAPHWKNQNPLTLGNITLEVEAVTGAYVVSYNGVACPTGATTTSTYQVAFLPSGDVEYRYATMSVNGGGSFPEVVGWSVGAGPGGPALDRGSMDITAAAPFSTAGQDNAPLTLSMTDAGGAAARPVLGTNPKLNIQNYGDATHPFLGLGVLVLSFTQINPGIPLTAVGFAAPECSVYAGSGSVGVVFMTPVPGPHIQDFINGGIPNNPTFNGALLFAQVGTFTNGYNPAGILSSNGLRLKLGTL